MRAFVIMGRTATADDTFSLDDLPGTSGRLDVLLRCVRAALLVSHGVRSDTRIYLVLLGGPHAPRVVRVRGDEAKFVRPDERPLATLLKKSLAHPSVAQVSTTFETVRPGIAIAAGGLATALDDVRDLPLFVLDETGEDVAQVRLTRDAAFVVGDHLGLDDAARATLRERGAKALAIGPVSLHSDDVVAVVSNCMDRSALAPYP